MTFVLNTDEAGFRGAPPLGKSARVLVLCTELLTDRMVGYTQFLPRLRESAEVTVWAKSAGRVGNQPWDPDDAQVQPYPQVKPFRIFPHTYLRRLNEATWDWRLRTPTRTSIDQHLRKGTQAKSVRLLRWPARALAAMHLEQPFECFVLSRLETANRGSESGERLLYLAPSLVLSTDPFWYFDSGITSAARKLGIPSLALVTSFDNLSTKNRMPFRYDGFLVWSEQMRSELHEYYPYSRSVPTYVIGAPQFDILLDDRHYQTREEYCRGLGLRPEHPIVLHALGSPNLFREEHTARFLASQFASGACGDAQLLIRPHPKFDDGALSREFMHLAPRVQVRATATIEGGVNDRAQGIEQVRFWVNSFRHADVVVNLSSTCSVDAAILDRPVVNLDFDPDPARARQQLVKEINHTWIHFRPIAESGGVWLVNNNYELLQAIRGYLEKPELHRTERRRIVEHVTGFADGRCGERMADAVLDFLSHHNGSRHHD